MDAVHEALRNRGFAFESGSVVRAYLESTPRFRTIADDWTTFAESWNDLGDDPYLARKYMHRRRRHAVYSVAPDAIPRRETDRPHYQSPRYNSLQGGIERHLSPVEPWIGEHPSMLGLIDFGADVFSLRTIAPAWHAEVHQFRIEATSTQPGFPTPEGKHRDGVDFVLVVMVRRQNMKSGVTTVHDLDGSNLGSFTLTEAFDTAFVDDRRILHGVTPVEMRISDIPAYRDVLVVTYGALAEPGITRRG